MTHRQSQRLEVPAGRVRGKPESLARVITELVGRDPSLVRGDFRAVGQQATPAV